MVLAYLGHQVSCVEKNKEIVAKLKAGEVPIHETGLEGLLAEVGAGMKFTSALAEAAGADVYIIAVGTPCKNNGDVDLIYVENAAKKIGELLSAGEAPIIVNKSTVPVGSARRLEAVIRSTLSKKGVEVDFGVASNPEFLQKCLKGEGYE